MRFIFRMIGFIVVVLVLLTAILFYLDSKDLLSGKLERLIGASRRLGAEEWAEIRLFLSDSGIAEDAADLLQEGVDLLRDGVTPHETEQPGEHAFDTPEPASETTPEPSPEITPEPMPSDTPVPTPYIVTIG